MYFDMVEAAGVELLWYLVRLQVTDFKKRQKRQNRSKRRCGVHGGYTEL